MTGPAGAEGCGGQARRGDRSFLLRRGRCLRAQAEKPDAAAIKLNRRIEFRTAKRISEISRRSARIARRRRESSMSSEGEGRATGQILSSRCPSRESITRASLWVLVSLSAENGAVSDPFTAGSTMFPAP